MAGQGKVIGDGSGEDSAQFIVRVGPVLARVKAVVGSTNETLSEAEAIETQVCQSSTFRPRRQALDRLRLQAVVVDGGCRGGKGDIAGSGRRVG